MGSNFSGFPEELFQFLSKLSDNNNREWFNANKERYRSDVVGPVTDFIEEMQEPLRRISDCFMADPRTNGGSMFRIYRDTRFSKNKQPYKTNVACQFRHKAGRDAHAPGFYLHLEPGKIFFGGGLWMPPNTHLEKVRLAIVERSDDWETIIKNKTFLKRFGEIKGEQLKRPPRGYSAEDPHIEDLKRKSFFIMQYADESIATSSGFTNEVEKTYKAAAPFMQFLTTSLGLPF